MSENINLKKQVFNKGKFDEKIDTNFNELIPQESQMFFDTNLANVNDFFLLYNVKQKSTNGRYATWLFLFCSV